MGNSLKHKWIVYALSVLVAAIAAQESVRLLFLLLIVLFFCLYKRYNIKHCVGVIALGLVSFFYFSIQLSHISQPLELPAILTWTDEYKLNGSKLRGFMKDEGGRKIYVTYELNSETDKNLLESIPLVGMRFKIIGVLEKPKLPNHQYAFNMESYLKSKGALGILHITDWTYIDTQSSISQRISVQRHHLIQHIENTFPNSLSAEAQSLLIGFQENVDSDMTRAYQKLGITHLFAISGLHIAILSLILFQGLLRIGVRKELATILLLVALPIYGVLAGGAPSVWRAVLVVEFILITQIKWKLPMSDALSISFIFFVFIEPWSIYQIGFQLSYLATVSLVYSGKLLNRYRSWIVQSFFITFVCQLIVYPLLLFHFYEISISSLIANIIFVPLFSFIILPINIVLLIASYIPVMLERVLFFFYEPIRTMLSQFILWAQTIPYQMWIPGKPSYLLMILAYICVFSLFYLFDKRVKIWKCGLFLFIPILLLQIGTKWTEDMKISFISVGQGDCILIELPYREEIYLIDTGGVVRFEQEEWKETTAPYEIGRQVVVPYLKGKGIHRIDKLIITHADSDHVEGAEEVLQEIGVSEIHISPNSYTKDVMNELLEVAKQKGIPIKEQKAGYHWSINGYLFQYLWPMDLTYEGNNDSLVLYVTKGSFQALFTGDLVVTGEEQLLKQYPQIHHIDILKAGHHGSKTSSSQRFVETLLPQLTIFSTGENNRYGHPHQEVVERFQSYGLQMIDTKDSGTIEITVTDEGMVVFRSHSLFIN